MRKTFTTAALCLALAAPAFADNHGGEAASDKPAISATRTATMSATVEAINLETREITLRNGQGESTTLTPDESAQNLDQIEVGDLVLAEVTEQVTIEVMANPDGIEPGAGEVQAAIRAEKGEMPGAAVMDTMIITAVVEDINIEANTFKLRGPEGNIREFTARDPENLKKADVGDLVVITVTQAMGIMVEHPNNGK